MQAFPADIANIDETHAIAGFAAAMLGHVDLLIHNASSLGPVPLRLLLDTECEDFDAVLQANLLGPFRLTKAIAGSMLLRRAGTIVQISSDAALEAYPRWGAYSVSKAAADHLMRIFAVELADTGVRFLAIDPGEMDTDMHRAALPDADVSQLARPEQVARSICAMLAAADVPTGSRVLAHASGSPTHAGSA